MSLQVRREWLGLDPVPMKLLRMSLPQGHPHSGAQAKPGGAIGESQFRRPPFPARGVIPIQDSFNSGIVLFKPVPEVKPAVKFLSSVKALATPLHSGPFVLNAACGKQPLQLSKCWTKKAAQK
jgi:hypothetical protein